MKAANIKWETDGEDVNLPTEMDIPEYVVKESQEDEDAIDEDAISDYISNITGWLHNGFEIILTIEDEKPKCSKCDYKNHSKSICNMCAANHKMCYKRTI